MRRPLALVATILCVIGIMPKAVAQTIEGFGVGKKRDFLQTSAATPTSSAILGDPNGPYHFSADISGTSLNLLNPAPKVTTPNAAQYTLVGDSTDRGIASNYSTKAALDAAFPNSLVAYTFTAGPYSLPIAMGDIDYYPTGIPQVTNNTWNAAGQLVINPLVDSTLNFSDFSEYASGIGGIIDISIYGLTGNTAGGFISGNLSTAISGVIQETKLTSYTIPANFLQGNRTYYVELTYARIANIDISSPQRVGIATFVNSTAFIITTEPPDALPFFRRYPGDQTATVGSQIDIFTLFDGYPVPTCQWYKNGVPINGATASNLRLDNVQFSDAGIYSEVITNRAGSVTSNEVTVTVNSVALPTFTTPLQDVTTQAGGRAFFLTNTAGPTPITYQWYFNGQPIGGANLFQLEILNVQEANAGDYYLVATNAGGSVATNTVKLRLTPAVGVLDADGGWGITYFLRSDSSLWAIGTDSSAIPSDGSTFFEPYPTKITEGVARVAPGYTHCLFIKSDGTLWAMGNNSDGQLGDGTKVYRKNPVQIATGVVSASCGISHSLFIKMDGSLWGMGRNDNAQLGIDDISDFPTPILLDRGVISVSAGDSHSLYLKYDGTMWGVGDNYYGQLGDGTQITRTHPIQIALGVKVILAGDGYSMYLKQDGDLWAVGANGYGQFGDGTRTYRMQPAMVISGVRSISGGGNHNMLIKTDGSLWTIGNNVQGQLGDGTQVDRSSPIQISTGVASAATGASHSIYVQNDGTLWGMGYDYYGQLGDGGQWNPSLVPVKIAHGPLTVPAAPAAVTTNGETLLNAVRINWDIASAATSYEVWRNTTNSTASATRIAGNVPIALYYDLTAAPGTNYFYWIKAANPAGTSSFSASDSGVIGAPPTFTTQPISQIATVGASVTFTVAATGAPSPTLQWQKNGADIGGATGSSYTVASVAAGDVASYTVIATNSVGAVTSDPATLALGTIPDGFDMTAYLTRYPDVAAIYGANPYAAWIHYRDVGIYQGEVFDELFRVEEYLTLYPELFAVFGTDLGGALVHWLNEGRIEGRLGRIPLEFNAQGYFDRNPDVAAAAGNNPLLAWAHFWAYGIYEGRAYDEDFLAFEYLAINADLTAAFVNDWRQAALHWMRYGRTEGRLGRLPLTFSVATYLSRNPNVAAVWGTDPTTVFLHFWLYGINEARTYDDRFRVDDYLALNPDLAAVFGTDKRGAFKHWVRYGRSEGRPGRNP